MSNLSFPLGPHLFDADALKKAIEVASADIPSGKQNAIVGTVDASGAKVAVVIHAKNGWSAQFAAAHEWSGDNKIAGKLIKSW